MLANMLHSESSSSFELDSPYTSYPYRNSPSPFSASLVRIRGNGVDTALEESSFDDIPILQEAPEEGDERASRGLIVR